MRLHVLLCALVCALLAVSCAHRSAELLPQVPVRDANALPDITTMSTASASPYTYAGCPVYTYNDWFTTNLLTGGSSYVSNTVDPNSATILSHYNSTMGSVRFNINGSPNSVSLLTRVNLASTSTPLIGVTRTSCNYGCYDDAYNDEGSSVPSMCIASCAWRIPWRSGFAEQGLCSTGDCHDEVINTQTCVAYETYTSHRRSYTGATFDIEDGGVHNLRHSWDSQRNRGPDAAGIPYIGTALWGEDAVLASINHIIAVSIAGYAVASGGWVKPAVSSHHCKSGCIHPLPMGARLRLNRYKYSCPSAASHPQAHKICVTMETYGIVIVDWNSSGHMFGPGLEPTRSGADPWNETDVAALNGIPITDFDIMTMTTYYP